MMVPQDLNQVVETLLVIVDEQLVLDMIIDEPLVLDEQLVHRMIDDELVLHIFVVVEEMCIIVIVEELLKTVDGTEVDYTEVDDCFSMEVFSIWKAFGGNTRDLGSFGEETDKTTDLHQHLSRLCSQRLETASQDTRDAVTIHPTTVSQEITTASARTTQPKI
ncbi:hypothetical protein Tco_0578765 [Tanacetum coccineum]